MGKTQSKILQEKIKNDEFKIWNKGLTKEIDERLIKSGEKISQIWKEKWANGDVKCFISPSKSEIEFGNKIKEIFGIELKSSYWLKGKIYDYRVPHNMNLIETDGTYWHSTQKQIENDKYKNQLAKNSGYTLYRFKLDSVNEVEKLVQENYSLLEKILQ